MSKKTGILLLDAAILLCTLLCAVLSLWFMNGIVRYVTLGVCVLIVLVLLITEGISFIAISRKSGSRRKPEASALVLLNDAEQEIRRWTLTGNTSLLLGKGGTVGINPEIDLGDTEFGVSIDEQQAVLNYSPSGWVIEDLSSRNGTILQRPGEDARKLVEGVPCLIQPGDRLYVAADTILAVK